jgi:hypothetical protein
MPSKRIRSMKMTLENSEARAVIQNNMTESFNVNIAVIQGDAISVICVRICAVQHFYNTFYSDCFTSWNREI